jgi:TolA-binding protein
LRLAEEKYKQLIVKFPNSVLLPKAKVNLGLLLYNQNRYQEALQLYKEVVADYPGTNEAKNALIGLKNIHVDKNEVQQYFDYVKELDETTEISINISEQDSLTYLAAERVYMSGDCAASVKGLKEYLEKFPTGHFAVNANFYLADCFYQQKEFDNALPHFQFVNSQKSSVYAEQAILGTSRIYYAKRDYENALASYLVLEKLANDDDVKLEAYIGQLNCYSSLGSDKKTIEASEKILGIPKLSLPIVMQVKFKYAKALYAEGRLKEAYEEFKITSEDLKTPEGAESLYMRALILYELDKWPQAEAIIYGFIDQNTPHQYWLAKSFLLLADIFIDTSDEFQANPYVK